VPNPIPIVLVFLVLAVPLVFVVANRLRMDLAAMIMAASLGIFQLFGLSILGPANSPGDVIKAISGFSQPVVITLLSLFIITRGLDKSGVTRWIAQRVMKVGGQNEGLLIALFTATTAFLSLFMNNLAAGALVLPSALEVARRTHIKPSKFLIPVAYGSLLGGAATYFTTANIIVSNLLPIANPPQAPLNILDFTPTGGLIAIAGILFFWIFGKRLLPERESAVEKPSGRLTSLELENYYQIKERLWEARVPPGSAFCRHTLEESGIGQKWGLAVAAIQQSKENYTIPFPEIEIMPEDRLILVGREEKIRALRETGLEIEPIQADGGLSQCGIALVELILAPHSDVEGRTLKEIDFRKRFGVTVIALRRLNRSFRTDVGNFSLALGDTFLAIGSDSQVGALKKNPDFIVLEPDSSSQPLRRGPAILTTAIILAAIAASIAGAPVYLCMLTGAVLSVLTGVLNMEEAYQSVEWQAIFLIAGIYVVSLAMVQTGAASLLGQGMIDLVKSAGPLGIAAGAYLLTTLLTQFMGGQVTALVTGPITISAAISMGVSPQAIAVATAIGCSASFLTPMAHPVNILMIGPANYKFSDFFRSGWLLTIISFVMLMVGLKLFWGL
jgi:di/tricarboxylate transporter